jgi:DNA-binding CsgD family transcriptional regulator
MKTMTALDLHPESRRRAAAERIKHGFLSGHFNHEENVVFKDGADCTLLITASRIPYDGKTCLIGTCIDITEKKKAQDQLKRFAANLEEANITLRVLMKHNKQEQKHFENKLQTYVNDLVMPYLDKLRKANLDERSKKYLRELENNLTGVLSPFLSTFQTLYKKLTPQEIQIVDLIGKGKCTKEIADMLNVAVNTVATHRNNIRKKLNLRNAKVNLRSHLMSLR